MRKITFLFFFFLLKTLMAQVPEKFSYQAIIRDSTNALIINQSVGVRISILQGSVNGNTVYAESHSLSTNNNGLISLEMGSGTLISGSFQSIDWSNGPYFIKSETDPAGGSNYSISNTSQLLSVPYALHSKTADALTGGGTGGGFSHYIGEVFAGGIIFYLWKDASGAEHGLICDLNDLGTGQIWSNVTTTLIGTAAQSSWDGQANSNAILTQAGHTNSAALVCNNSVNVGQTDWYLPSIDELSLMWHQRFIINKSIAGITGGSPLSLTDDYWSSTEYGSNFGYTIPFLTGVIGYANKSNPRKIRAVRKF